MTYELAKKLLDAGFPGMEERIAVVKGETRKLQGITGIPSLSKLIEACGDKFGNLNRGYEGRFYVGEYNMDTEQFSGSTPQEAVANLWLELNKKSV